MDSSVVADYPAICRTLPALLAWLEEPRADKGVRFASDGGQWAFRSYAELAAASRQAASGLMALGVRSNDVVSLALHSGPEFVSAFFGAMLAGAVPSAAAPFTRFQRQSAYTLYTRGILATVRPRVVIAESASVFAFGSARLSGAPRVVTFGELLRRAGRRKAERSQTRTHSRTLRLPLEGAPSPESRAYRVCTPTGAGSA